MPRSTLIVAAAALAAFACADTTADPIGPIQAAVTKVALCHWDATTGQFTLINVPVGGKPYQKHLAHGDGEPGGPVPDMAGYVFDIACVPVLAERVFAIAYTDVNPNDGLGFKAGVDVLIAKLVDANNDGVVSAGDRVILGRYPKNFDATEFGDFGATEHTVDGVLEASAIRVLVTAPTGGTYTGFFVFCTQPEGYSDGTPDPALNLVDGVAGTDYYFDRIDAVAGATPSQPDASLTLFRNPEPSRDDGFVDVEINLSGL